MNAQEWKKVEQQIFECRKADPAFDQSAASIENMFADHDFKQKYGAAAFEIFDRVCDDLLPLDRAAAHHYVAAEGLETFMDVVLAGVPVSDVIA